MALFKNRYKLVKEIGSGTSGKALLVQDLKEALDLVVLKEIPLNADEIESSSVIKEEVGILSRLSHPYIIKYFGSFEENGNLYIVTEYANEGDLYQLLKTQKLASNSAMLEELILKFSAQLISALAYLHEHKILHRDIKSRNIFLFSSSATSKLDHVKLGDFGISRSLSGTIELAHTAIGTPYYLSPEICESKPYDYKSDIWSLGCVVYEMCTLRHAFDSRHIRGLILKIIKAEYAPIPKKRFVSNLAAAPKGSGKAADSQGTFKIAVCIALPSQQNTHQHDRFKQPAPSKKRSSQPLFIDKKIPVLVGDYLFGDISRETILDCYKWSERDSFEDILQHIEWSHDKRQLHENNLSFDGRKTPIDDNVANHREEKHSFSYYRISVDEYILNGRLFSLGSFGTLGSSILCSWIQGPNHAFEDTPSSEEISAVIGPHKKSSSIMLKMEIVKDYLKRELGKATFVKVCATLRDLVNIKDTEPSKIKFISEEMIFASLGDFIFSLLIENNLLFLLVHLIINEKMINHTSPDSEI